MPTIWPANFVAGPPNLVPFVPPLVSATELCNPIGQGGIVGKTTIALRQFDGRLCARQKTNFNQKKNELHPLSTVARGTHLRRKF